jgi:thiopeptide-type bacteriocin biosynthesis protein
MTGAPPFRTADLVLLRLAARPSPVPGGAVPPAPPGTDPRTRIVALAADRGLMEAVEAASPSLARDVAKVVRGEPEKPSRLRRTAVALTKYHLRMTGRATPFGLFAGVAPLQFTDAPRLRADMRPLPASRPHAEWLRPLVARLHAAPAVLAECVVVADPVHIVRGDRLHLPEHFDHQGENRVRASIRHTRAVAAVRHAAAAPIAWKALVDGLVDDLPPERREAARPTVESLLRRLVDVGLLLTDLEPPAGCADPLGHLLDRPGVLRHPIADRLGGIRRGLQLVDAAPPDRRPGLRRALVADMKALQDADTPVQADLRIGVEGGLPRDIGTEAAQAASVLWRMTRPGLPPGLGDYHRRFVARYGTDRAVGLIELLDDTRGLGAPDTHDDASPDDADPRWRWLGELLDGRDEIELDDAALDRLPDPGPGFVPPSMELCVEVVASSWDDLVAGRFRLVVGENLGSAQAGSTIARLSHLLPELDDELTRLAVDGTPRHSAQVAFRTRSPRAATVASVPQRLPLRIPLGVGPTGATDIPPDVLAIVATTERLHVVDTRTGERIVPVTGSMLNPGSGEMPPRARLLVDIGQQDQPRCQPWTWGPFRHLPYLPRVRYGRTVLAPARWLPSTRMLDAAAGTGDWTTHVRRWRADLRVPRVVHAAVADQKMRIDLDDELHLEVLRTELRSRHRLQITEVLTDSGWLRGPDGAHTGEIVVQLLGTAGAPAPPAIVPEARPRQRAAGTAPRMPGGDWLYLKLYAGPDALREILTSRLGALTDPVELDRAGVRGWFHLPYGDPDPHLRLRFTGDPTRMWPALLPRLHDWTAALHDAGLLRHCAIDTYDPEIERFGGAEPLRAAERVFHADSVLALELLAGGPTDATAALSVLELLDGFVPRPRLIELLEAITPPAARRASPRDGRAAMADLLSEERAVSAARAAAVTAYLTALQQAGCPSDQRERVGLTLAHLHCLRLFGTDRAAEHRVLALLHGGLVLRRERQRNGR